jgi:hypothetical protein
MHFMIHVLLVAAIFTGVAGLREIKLRAREVNGRGFAGSEVPTTRAALSSSAPTHLDGPSGRFEASKEL